MNENNINLIFETIEKKSFIEKYHIVNYTISSTSLEDVFLKLNNNEVSNLMLNNNSFLNTNNELMDISTNNILNNSSNSVPNSKSNSINVIIRESNNDSNNINNENKSCGIKFFFIELCGGIKRNLIPLWRNKCNFVVEVLSASMTILIYLLGLNTLFSFSENKNIELMKLYDGIPIYYSTNFEKNDTKEFFDIYDKENIIFKKYPFFKIKEIDYTKHFIPNDIDKMSDYFYNISKYKNERNF